MRAHRPYHWVQVAADGSIVARGPGVSSVVRESTGVYLVTWVRPIAAADIAADVVTSSVAAAVALEHVSPTQTRVRFVGRP